MMPATARIATVGVVGTSAALAVPAAALASPGGSHAGPPVAIVQSAPDVSLPGPDISTLGHDGLIFQGSWAGPGAAAQPSAGTQTPVDGLAPGQHNLWNQLTPTSTPARNGLIPESAAVPAGPHAGGTSGPQSGLPGPTEGAPWQWRGWFVRSGPPTSRGTAEEIPFGAANAGPVNAARQSSLMPTAGIVFDPMAGPRFQGPEFLRQARTHGNAPTPRQLMMPTPARPTSWRTPAGSTLRDPARPGFVVPGTAQRGGGGQLSAGARPGGTVSRPVGAVSRAGGGGGGRAGGGGGGGGGGGQLGSGLQRENQLENGSRMAPGPGPLQNTQRPITNIPPLSNRHSQPPYLYRLVMATGSFEAHGGRGCRFGVCLTCSLPLIAAPVLRAGGPGQGPGGSPAGAAGAPRASWMRAARERIMLGGQGAGGPWACG